MLHFQIRAAAKQAYEVEILLEQQYTTPVQGSTLTFQEVVRNMILANEAADSCTLIFENACEFRLSRGPIRFIFDKQTTFQCPL